MKVKATTTYAKNYAITIEGEIAEEAIEFFIGKGVESHMYRGGAGKLDLILAKSVGKVKTLKNGEQRPEDKFERGALQYNAELNPKLADALEEFFADKGDFAVEVKKYEADGAATAKEKEQKAKIAAIEGLRGIVDDAILDGQIEKIKAA